MNREENLSSRSKYFNRGTLLGLVSGVFFSALLFASMFVTGHATWRPASDLTNGIGGGTWEQLTAQFDGRLKRRFPIGIQIREVTNTLRNQGFELKWNVTPTGEYLAIRDESNFACNIPAEVYWTVTKGNQLGSIRGVYQEQGCL
jgi:hypothetical protein